MPGVLAAGTSLFQIIFTTAFSTLMHAGLNHNVDVLLAAMLICGSVVGAQFGIRVGRHVKGLYARVTLALLILAVSVSLVFKLFKMPAELFSTVPL